MVNIIVGGKESQHNGANGQEQSIGDLEAEIIKEIPDFREILEREKVQDAPMIKWTKLGAFFGVDVTNFSLDGFKKFDAEAERAFRQMPFPRKQTDRYTINVHGLRVEVMTIDFCVRFLHYLIYTPKTTHASPQEITPRGNGHKGDAANFPAAAATPVMEEMAKPAPDLLGELGATRQQLNEAQLELAAARAALQALQQDFDFLRGGDGSPFSRRYDARVLPSARDFPAGASRCLIPSVPNLDAGRAITNCTSILRAAVG